MKNVHLIATDKPSRLIHNDANQLCYQSNKSFKNDRKWMYRKKFNIYITNSEEIKYGDWQLSNDKHITIRTNSFHESDKKIILTTDQSLDGVQAIDDEFLEWFVKNPNCEEVRVVDDTLTVKEMSKFPLGTRNHKYKIIIPKEEPKQETLEEAAERLSKNAYIKHSVKDNKLSLDEQIQRSGGFIVGFKEGMIEGAKQAERSQQIVPFDAYNIEVFAIKPDEQGKLFAYIGYNITNGNFHFNVVPFTEPKQEKEKYSEEDMTNYALYILHNNVITPKEWLKQFKKK